MTAPAALAEAVCGINAGLIFDPVEGVLAAGCTAGFVADCAGGLAAGLEDGGVERELAGEVVTGKAGDCTTAVDLDCAGGCKLADALAFMGLAREPAASGLASGVQTMSW